MKDIQEFDINEIIPHQERIYSIIGAKSAEKPAENIEQLVNKSIILLKMTALPAGIAMEITGDEFKKIYYGEGLNEPETPIAEVYPKAERLALFALTLGQGISSEIERLFKNNDFALGYILDAIASEAAELGADMLEKKCHEGLLHSNATKENTAYLRYSPGYCGWHITGQRRLLERLKPERIGITLNESCLMQPLKSISGVIVSAERKHHLIKNDYPFCAACTHHSCRERINLLLSNDKFERR